MVVRRRAFRCRAAEARRGRSADRGAADGDGGEAGRDFGGGEGIATLMSVSPPSLSGEGGRAAAGWGLIRNESICLAMFLARGGSSRASGKMHQTPPASLRSAPSPEGRDCLEDGALSLASLAQTQSRSR